MGDRDEEKKTFHAWPAFEKDELIWEMKLNVCLEISEVEKKILQHENIHKYSYD